MREVEVGRSQSQIDERSVDISGRFISPTSSDSCQASKSTVFRAAPMGLRSCQRGRPAAKNGKRVEFGHCICAVLHCTTVGNEVQRGATRRSAVLREIGAEKGSPDVYILCTLCSKADGVANRYSAYRVLFVLNLLHLVFTATAVSCMACFAGQRARRLLWTPGLRRLRAMEVTLTASSRPSLPRMCFVVTVISMLGLFAHCHPSVCSLTAIIVSRFLLELQAATQTVVRLDPDDPLHSSRNPYDSTPRFISSLGGFINMELPVPSDDVLEVNVGSYSDGEDRSMSFE